MSEASKAKQAARALAKGDAIIKGKDGKVYDAGKGTIDGIPPIEEGDVFYYRAKDTPGPVVYAVEVAEINGKIARFWRLPSDDFNRDPEACMLVDLRRIEVVQMIMTADEAKKQRAEELNSDLPDDSATQNGG